MFWGAWIIFAFLYVGITHLLPSAVSLHNPESVCQAYSKRTSKDSSGASGVNDGNKKFTILVKHT